MDARSNRAIVPAMRGKKMNSTTARKIARHLIGDVHIVAASPGCRTYGFNYVCGDRRYSTAQIGEYHHAVKARAEYVADLAASLIAGEAPAWATPDFCW